MGHETNIKRNLKINVVCEEKKIEENLEIHMNSPRFMVQCMYVLCMYYGNESKSALQYALNHARIKSLKMDSALD